MTNSGKPQKQETSLFSDVLQIIQTARQKAYSAINTAMVEAYWLMGKRIVDEAQKGAKRATYGEGIIKEFSKQLKDEFRSGTWDEGGYEIYLFEIPKNLIKGIILGCNIDENNRKTIIELSKNLQDIKLRQSELDEKGFKLNFIPISSK